MIDRHQSVASLVLEHSECVPVLQRHRIDFCCRGELSLEAAAAQRQVDLDALLGAVRGAIEGQRGEPGEDPRQLPTPQLVEHIVARHHTWLRDALPFIGALAVKVSRVHGEHQPSLRVLEVAVLELVAALSAHLDEEESALFPALVATAPDRAALAAPLAAMQAEHLKVAALLERIREASGGFALPDWACNSYRTLFASLERLEADVFRHVHLENHVLRPRFAAA
jgi:regulator of cell morphogenesis and NO signaling